MHETLVEIYEQPGLSISLAYATPDNFTGKPVYAPDARCFLHRDAALLLDKAFILAQKAGFGLKIFDAFRPADAQQILWSHTPDPTFLADPAKGSPHSRGVAIDLTLTDESGIDLDMGTAFDAFTPRSWHGDTEISIAAQQSRFLLLGIMSAAGWDFYSKEWWHYQMFNSRQYQLLSDAEAGTSMLVTDD